jgi:hypothetical protein
MGKRFILWHSLSLFLFVTQIVYTQTGSANQSERDLVRRELEYRIGRDRGYNVEIRLDTAETYFVSNGENSVRGRAQYRDRSGRWDTVWYDSVIDTRRSRITRLDWGLGNRSGGRDDNRYNDRYPDRSIDRYPNDRYPNERYPGSGQGVLRPGRYTIQLVATGRMLDVSGRQVVQRGATSTRSQEWEIEDAGNGLYFIRSAYTGDVMTVEGRGDNGSNIILTRQQRGDENQLWEIRHGPDNGYYFIARNGRSMDSPSSARYEGGRMQLYSRNGEANQRFRLQLLEDRGRADDRFRDRDRWDNRDRNRDSWGSSGRLSWRGRVDGEIEIEIRGSSVRERHLSGQPPFGVRTNSGWSLPRRDVNVRVEKLRGRGRVEVVEQPSARNGYVAVIRINDSQGGADDYELEVSWN